MRLTKIIILLALFLVSPFSYAAKSNELHRCFLLPVSDGLEGTIGEEIFSQTEKLIKNYKWCDYQEDPKLQKILYKYRHKLDEALTTSDVLKLVAAKSNAGSVIRISTQYIQQKMRLTIEIVDSQGRDYLYRKSAELEDDSIAAILEIIGESLQEYAHDLPYRAIVVEHVENDLILKMVGDTPLVTGNILRIEYPVKPIMHPLLKKVVEWETDKIGEAVVQSIKPPFARAHLTPNKSKKAAIGLWASVVRPGIPPKNPNAKEEYKRTISKIYELSGRLDFTRPYASNNFNSERETLNGKLFTGVEGKGRLLLTPDFWGELILNYRIGLTGGASSSSEEGAQVKLGYRFHPIRHNHDMHLSPYISYDYQSFDYNSSNTTNFVPTSFTSYMLGLIGVYPLLDRYSIVGEMSFAVSSSITAEGNKYSGSKDSSVGKLEFAAHYDYQSPYDLFAGIGYQKYTANFDQDELNFGTLKIFGGIIYKY